MKYYFREWNEALEDYEIWAVSKSDVEAYISSPAYVVRVVGMVLDQEMIFEIIRL